MYDFLHTTYNIQHTTYKKRGFTLIELLVVVAIIGILSVAAFATFGNTRGRARDAVRLSDISQMQSVLLIENITPVGSRNITGCIVAHDAVTDCTGAFAELALFEDPRYSANGECKSGAVVADCDYSISLSTGAAAAKTGNYQICFYLEDRTSAGLSTGPGLVKVIYNEAVVADTKLGDFREGCL